MQVSESRRRRLMLAIGAIAAGAAVFVSGTLVGRATADEATSPESDGASTNPGQVAIAPDLPANVPATGIATDGGAGARGGAQGPGATSIAYGCEAPIGDVITGNTIDLSKRGFVPRFPGAGWTLVNVSFRAQGECGPDGVTKNPALTMDTSWVHTATGLSGHVMQMADSKPHLNVLAGTYANFADGGYQFQVNVNGYQIATAKDMPASPGGAGSTPAIAPIPPDADPRTKEVLEALVLALQPKGGLQCFYREAVGSWPDLQALGIGDPRPAIPSGLKLQDARVTTYTAPAAGCDVAPGKPNGTGFNGVWVPEGAPANVGALFVSAWAKSPEAGDYPGQFNEYSASWSNADYQFSIGMKSAQPLGEAKLRAIAKLLDSNFEKACFAVQRKLTEADLAGFGLRKPTVPDGFTITNEWMTATELNANCTGTGSGFQPSVNLGWNMEDKAGTAIQASVNQLKAVAERSVGYIGDNHISWMDAKGNQYFVQGSTRGVNGVVAKELLLQVAKSMDPTLDESTLQPGGGIKGGPPPAQPMPATP